MTLKERIAKWDLFLTDDQIEQFHMYCELLSEWNQVMNLTTSTDPEEVDLKHFTDSLALGVYFKPGRSTLIDVGTGAGFPGLALKIAFPELEVTLADSISKRISFLDTVIRTLGLSGIRTIHGRAEDLARDPGLREQFDLCCARAVANLSTLSEYCLPFVKCGGTFVAYKSEDVDEELAAATKAIRKLGGSVERKVSYELPFSDVGRSLIFLKKTDPTPGQYPRKAGTPSKKPLA